MTQTYRAIPRKIKNYSLTLSYPEIDAPVTDWLQAQMKALSLPLLLAHLTDGVTWGELQDGAALVTSHDALKNHPEHSGAAPELRDKTLLQARAFSATAELFVWRADGKKFCARLLVEGAGPAREAIDEAQMLWGDRDEALPGGFTLWRDGAQGLLHALPHPPCKITRKSGELIVPPLLAVRHYLADERTARIELSRLRGLIAPEESEILSEDPDDDEDENGGQ